MKAALMRIMREEGEMDASCTDTRKRENCSIGYY